MPLFWVLLHLSAAGVLVALVNRLGLVRWRRARAAHWTERARLLWPVRFTAGLNIFLIPLLLSETHQLLQPEPLPVWVIYYVAGMAGTVLGGYGLNREIHPELDFRRWCHHMLALWGLRSSGWLMLLAAGLLMPADPGWEMGLVTGAWLGFHLLRMRGFLLRSLTLVNLLRPAGSRLQGIVAAMSGRMGIQPGATWELSSVLANAAALPTTRELFFTSRLLELCTDEEVAGIAAHELAHLSESNAVRAGRLLGSLLFFPLIFLKPCATHFGVAGVAVLELVLLLLLVFSRQLSQRMEKRADALARQEQTGDGIYARTLEKLYQSNQMPAVMPRGRRTHPHLYDRMLAAGLTPDYPRPTPPGRITLPGWVIIAGIVVMALALALA